MHLKDPGKDLIQDIRSKQEIQFNISSFNDLLEETTLLQTRMESIKEIAQNAEVTTEMSIQFMIYKQHEARNERIRLAYLKHRFLDVNTKRNKEEIKFDAEMSNVYDEYAKNFKFLKNTNVPLNLYVRIKVLKECGVVMVKERMLTLEVDKIYFLKRKYIEHLIAGGSMIIV